MTKFLKSLIIIVIGSFLIYSLTKNIFDYREKVKFFSMFKGELEEEKEKQKELESEIIKNKDLYQVERKIRENLNLLKQDEVAVILPQKTPTPTVTPKVEKPPIKQWIELLFDI